MIFEKANPDNKKTVTETAAAFWNIYPAIAHPVAGTLTGLKSEGESDQPLCFMARQAHFLEVEVDTETGQVEVTNTVCVNDVGHVFNPQALETYRRQLIF
jgi:CO/xanthine dehydrogenase Mo-binding subunit